MIETVFGHIPAFIDIQHDEVLDNWSWRVGNDPWSKPFTTRLDALLDSKKELYWRVNYVYE